MVKNLPTNAGDAGSIPGSGRSPGGENRNPLQYSCLENSMYRGARQATVHGVAELDRAEQLSTHTDPGNTGGQDIHCPFLMGLVGYLLLKDSLNWANLGKSMKLEN